MPGLRVVRIVVLRVKEGKKNQPRQEDELERTTHFVEMDPVEPHGAGICERKVKVVLAALGVVLAGYVDDKPFGAVDAELERVGSQPFDPFDRRGILVEAFRLVEIVQTDGGVVARDADPERVARRRRIRDRDRERRVVRIDLFEST